MTVAEQGRAQAGADGDDQHHAGDAPARAEPHFGQPGHVGVVGDPNRAVGLARKIVGHRQPDEGGVDVGRRAGDAMLDGSRKADADRTRPAVLFDQRPDRDADGFGHRRAERREAEAVARQLPGRGLDHDALDPRPADVDAQNFHALHPPRRFRAFRPAPPAPGRAAACRIALERRRRGTAAGVGRSRTAPESAEAASRPPGVSPYPTPAPLKRPVAPNGANPREWYNGILKIVRSRRSAPDQQAGRNTPSWGEIPDGLRGHRNSASLSESRTGSHSYRRANTRSLRATR